MPTQYIHRLIVEDDKGRKEYRLEDSIYSIGRDQRADIRVFSRFVNRQQATLIRQVREDGSYFYQIVDGNANGKPSINGLLLNGQKCKAHYLQDQDEIIFGPSSASNLLYNRYQTYCSRQKAKVRWFIRSIPRRKPVSLSPQAYRSASQGDGKYLAGGGNTNL